MTSQELDIQVLTEAIETLDAYVGSEVIDAVDALQKVIAYIGE